MTRQSVPDPADMESALRQIVDLEKTATTKGDAWTWRRMWELAAAALDVADDPVSVGDRFVLPGLGADGGDATATIDAVTDGWATITWTNPDKTGHSALETIRRELRLGYWHRVIPESSEPDPAKPRADWDRGDKILAGMYAAAEPAADTVIARHAGMSKSSVYTWVAGGYNPDERFASLNSRPVLHFLTAAGLDCVIGTLGLPARDLTQAEAVNQPNEWEDES